MTSFLTASIIELPTQTQDFLASEYLGNSLQSYLSALGVFILFLLGLKIFRGFILGRLERLTARTQTNLDDKFVGIIKNVSNFFFWFLAFYLTIKTLNVGDQFQKFLDGLLILLAIIEVIKVVQNLLDIIFSRIPSLKNSHTALNGIKLITRMALWAIGLLLVLSNLGFNISTLAASMGIGGIAIALAAQNILSDLFASFTIYFDQPFQIGDFIVIGTDKGVVKRIGLKTTRLQTLQGEELVISNKELTEARVQNYKKMKQRKINISLGVVYGTSPAKLAKIPQIIKDIITAQENADPVRVHFKSFGDFSLNFQVVFAINSNDYDVYMDTQQAINLAIVEAFEKEKISMAFPTQTVHMVKS